MERLKNRILRRRSQSQQSFPPVEGETEGENMETDTPAPEEGRRRNPESSYLSLVPQLPSMLYNRIHNNTHNNSQDTNGNSNESNNLIFSDVLSSDDDPLAQQVQLLSEENDRLSRNVKLLEEELAALKESQASMISKSEDMNHSLELERKRFHWQKSFYERKILELVLANRSTPAQQLVNGSKELPPTTEDLTDGGKQFLESLSNSFYHDTILELVAEQERKDGELKEIKSAFEEEIRRLTRNHETAVSEIVESNLAQVAEMTATHDELIKDLLTGCEGLFEEMKVEFLQEAEGNVQLKEKTGNSLWTQFQGFSTEKKGVIVAGVCIITVATAGWASWGFIIWVWPRLVIFAESVAANPEVLARWVSFLVAFLNSHQFQNFVQQWESGQPLVSCLKSFLNTDILVETLQMAPNLFSQLKGRKTAQAHNIKI